MACTFCSIAAGTLAAEVVYEDERLLAFLDHKPLFAGHVLVVPRAHHETLQDVPEALLAPLLGEARRLGAALERALGAQGSFVAINNRVSQSVPHLHIHVVPRRRGDGLKGFFWPRHPYPSPEARRATAQLIREALAAH